MQISKKRDYKAKKSIENKIKLIGEEIEFDLKKFKKSVQPLDYDEAQKARNKAIDDA